VGEVTRVSYRIANADGLIVVQISGTDDLALAELHHYLLMYREEGPLTVEVKKGRKWKRLEMAT
jgi:hypothetical protein